MDFDSFISNKGIDKPIDRATFKEAMIEFLSWYFDSNIPKEKEKDLAFFVGNQISSHLSKWSGLGFSCDRGRMSVKFYNEAFAMYSN